jgi:DNA-binding MarR family transcriptional regulator
MRAAMNNSPPKLSKVTPLLHSMFKTQQYVDQLLSDHVGLGLSMHRILSVISDNIPSTQRQLALMLGQTEANVSRQVRHMADQGLIKIAPDKNDKRQRNITKTAKGRRRFADAEKVLKKHEKKLVSLLK